MMDRFEEKFIPEPMSGCWLWTACRDGHGYGMFRMDGTTLRANRVSYERYVGPIASGQIVRHKCDNPRCINPNHLELGTYKENTADMHKRHRAANKGPKGTAHPKVLLTDAQVLEIRALWNKGGMYLKEIAMRYGIAVSTVRSIAGGKNWKHLPLTEPCRIGKVGGKHTLIAKEWNT